MLMPRIFTALIGGALLLGSIYFGSLPFLFIVLGIVLLGTREFYTLAENTGYPCYSGIGLVMSALIVLSVFLNGVSFGQVTDNQTTSALIALIIILIVTRSLGEGAGGYLTLGMERDIYGGVLRVLVFVSPHFNPRSSSRRPRNHLHAFRVDLG